MQSLSQRLLEARPLILNGPTGTTLESRGFHSHPTLWTAAAAETSAQLLAAVHNDYLRAGAQLVTANTFRTTEFTVEKVGFPAETARRWLFASVKLARTCATEAGGSRYVVGSLAPLADCYHPLQTPTDAIVERAHRQTAAWLCEAGCDGILVETQGCGREARIAVAAAVAESAGRLPVLASFLPEPSGTRLLDGDDLFACAEECLCRGAAALLVNCAHGEVLLRALEILRPLAARGVPLGAYPNAAMMTLSDGEPSWIADPRGLRLAEHGIALRNAGARILGACCGYDAPDLASLVAAISETA